MGRRSAEVRTTSSGTCALMTASFVQAKRLDVRSAGKRALRRFTGHLPLLHTVL